MEEIQNLYVKKVSKSLLIDLDKSYLRSRSILQQQVSSWMLLKSLHRSEVAAWMDEQRKQGRGRTAEFWLGQLPPRC